MSEPAEPTNPILVWRNLYADTLTIKDKLTDLGREPGGIHGDLQVILSALDRMKRGVLLLIANEGAPT